SLSGVRRSLRWAPLRRRPLLGALRPTILIPPDLDRPEAIERLRLSLVHELAHAERADPWFAWAGALAQAVWFPVPWVWWITRQMRLDQEFLVDRIAASEFGPFGSYATSLVELADARSERRAPAARPTLLGAGSAL